MDGSFVFGCISQSSHPTLWKFIDKLILEYDSQIRTKIARVNAGEPAIKQIASIPR